MPRERFVPAQNYILADQARAQRALRLFSYEERPDPDDLLGSNRNYSEPDTRHISEDSEDSDFAAARQKTESPHGL
jgi:hypothetical protein